MSTCAKANASIWSGYAAAIRPPIEESVAQCAQRNRILHAVYCSEHPGKWNNSVFPCQHDVMNVTEEAITTGKNKVHMKSGQEGGTDCEINGMMFIKEKYPGPQLFITSTDGVAKKFGRQRFELIIRDWPSLREKRIVSKRGEMLCKRFVDGDITLCGGKSVNNLQSFPQRLVVFDEIDSLVENLGGQGDPIKLAEVRTQSFLGPTLIIAYAHPTSNERGAGKLYYELSDQRRAHITHSCGREFWINWFADVQCRPRLAAQSKEQAERDPDCYQLYCPGCNAVIHEAERVSMLRKGVKQKSVLPPEEAAKKTWIGVHSNQLYIPHKTLRSIAVKYIAALGDENAMRVFVNKVLGDCYEQKTKEIDAAALRALIAVKRRSADPEFFSRGQVPPAVLFLTAGQDSRTTELHYAIWGWGVRQDVNKARHLCGWLIEWAEIKRQYSLTFNDAEYHVFDDLIYRRRFACTDGDRLFYVRACAHDIGYQPTQMAVIRYARSWPGRAMPARGASETMTSASMAPYVRTAAAKKFKAGEAEVVDDPAMLFNTYMLKTDFYGMIDKRIEIPDVRIVEKDGVKSTETIGTRKVPLLNLPEDVDDRWIDQTKAEYLGSGKKRGQKVWLHKGPNHLADCNTYAHGLCMHFDAFSGNLTAEEYGQRQTAKPPARPPERRSGGGGGFGWNGRSNDPSMG